MSSAGDLRKQFGARFLPWGNDGIRSCEYHKIEIDQNVGPDLDPSCLTLVYLKEIFENVGFEKNQQTTKKHSNLPSRQRVNCHT